ncbi:MAG: hypothetical protein IJ463_08685 [Bacilli bacterium]|nr:hypothetical protein [Bacilli bacterium]
MMRDGINFLDADYEVVPLEKKPRQIRTKSTSFSQIKKYFNDFRIRLLTKKLEREKDKAVTEAYPERFTEKDDERMMKRASTIARLEQKIKILDGENVPVDYIDKRAIKIKKAMMKNISYTSGNIYTVGIENKDAVFEATKQPEVEPMDPELQKEIAANVQKIMDEKKEEEIQQQVQAEAEPVVNEPVVKPVHVEQVHAQEEVPSYTPSPVTKAEIRAEIDEEFEKLAGKAKKVADVQDKKVEQPHINLDEIKASIDEAFSEAQKDKVVPEATIGTAEVKDVVEESFESVDVDSKISLEDIKTEIDEAMERVVSKNGATSAKVDRFNEDGSRRETYNYTPMTDEEIRAAQENIEYDKYEEIYRQEHEQAKAAREAEQAQPVVEEEPYVYTPMTDEEIKAAQANIEYDKYEEIYRMQNQIKFETAEFKDIFKPADAEGKFNVEEPVVEQPVREVPVVVPEVDGERFVSKPHIVEEAAPSVVSRPTTIEEFGALKAKVEELKKKLAESESKKNTAVRFAERTSSRAEEIKRITIDSEKAYQDRIASLQLLAKTLEENCRLNETAAHVATKDAECNERFISSQLAKKDQFDEAISQVDSFLNFTYGEEEQVHRRRAA